MKDEIAMRPSIRCGTVSMSRSCPEAGALTASALPQVPILFEGLMRDWRAGQEWTPEFFAERYSSVSVVVTRPSSREQRRLSLGEYIAYMLTASEVDPYYLSNWRFGEDIPEMQESYLCPEFFESWHERLPSAYRPCWRWMFVGPAGSGTPMHLDVLSTSAWNAVTYGRKRWLFWSPDQRARVYDGKVNAFAPDLDRFPDFINAQAIECVQNPGEIVYTPTGWWHQVLNETACVSLTENFVNVSNASAVRRSIAHSGDLIRTWMNIPADINIRALISTYVPELGTGAFK